MRSRVLAVWLAMAPALAAAPAGIEVTLARTGQLLVVTAPDWDADHGTLALFERTPGGDWRRAAPDVPVMLGRNGLGWGVGLHAERATKREGDGRSPAGVFELARIHGREARAPSPHFPYGQLGAVMEGIDDPSSRFYNRLVDPSQVRDRDWTRSEKVRRSNPMFRWLVEVKHNWEQKPELGSCIYLHIWKAPGVATSGCTAMEEAALARVVHWLDARKRPLLVQLPRGESQRFKLP